MKKLINYLLFGILLSIPISVKSQTKFRNTILQYNFGNSHLMGDLGGSSGVGSSGIKDLDIQSTRYSFGIVIDKFYRENWFGRLSLTYVQLSSNDKFSEEISRKTRNLAVNTPVFELVPSVKYVFNSITGKEHSSYYKLFHPQFYASIGVGLIYFQPTGQIQNKTYDLNSLNTEGQGLPGGAKKYSKVSVVCPLTIGIRKNVTLNSGISLEINGRKCFTDYLDDVSTNYYDNKALENSKGAAAAQLADPNLTQNKNPAGMRRGNPAKSDSYFTIQLGYYRNLVIKPKHPSIW